MILAAVPVATLVEAFSAREKLKLNPNDVVASVRFPYATSYLIPLTHKVYTSFVYKALVLSGGSPTASITHLAAHVRLHTLVQDWSKVPMGQDLI